MNLSPHGPMQPPPLPDIGEAYEFEPDSLPVEPDEGPVPPFIPDDSEYEHLVDSAAMQPPQGSRRTKAPRSAPGLPLPHERDASPEPTTTPPDPVIGQARRDIAAGMVDTDMRPTPGLDANLRGGLVPTPGGPR